MLGRLESVPQTRQDVKIDIINLILLSCNSTVLQESSRAVIRLR